MGWKTGFEPATPGITIRCSNQLSYIHHRAGIVAQAITNIKRAGQALGGLSDAAGGLADPIVSDMAAFGAPDRTRTCNRRLRRPVLYPVELRALGAGLSHYTWTLAPAWPEWSG